MLIDINRLLTARKYLLDTSDYIEIPEGKRLFRVVALRDFGNVKTGDRGGYIESERNLSQRGRSWVGDKARVYGGGRVCGNGQASGCAQVRDNARISGRAHASGNSELFDDALASGRAQIYGCARVFGMMWLSGKARAYGSAALSADWWIVKGDWSGRGSEKEAQADCEYFPLI